MADKKNRQTLLPPPPEEALAEMIGMFDLLADIPCRDVPPPESPCPLRPDVPDTSPRDALRACFPMMGERGIEMPRVLPRTEEEK